MIERFGGDLEFDLHAHLGVDLLDFFRGNYTWSKLTRLAEHLPWWSRYQLAVADDDEIAERYLETGTTSRSRSSGNKRPPLTSWDPIREVQAVLVDGFNTLVAAQSSKKKSPKPTPRPETGYDRAKRAQVQSETSTLFDLFTPGR